MKNVCGICKRKKPTNTDELQDANENLPSHSHSQTEQDIENAFWEQDILGPFYEDEYDPFFSLEDDFEPMPCEL